MKIALVMDNMGYGGAQSVCVDYIKILSNQGHNIVFFNLAPDKTEVESRIPTGIKIIHYKMPLNAVPTRYFALIKAFWFGKYIFPFVYVYKKICVFFRKLFFKYRREKFDLAIAFAGHYNDLTFVSDNFVKASKKMCWSHGALFQNCITSDGFLPSYLKIRNIIVLNKTAQEEVFASNHYCHLDDKLNVQLLLNPVKMEGKMVDLNKVAELKKEYGDFMIMVARLSYPHKDQYTVIKALSTLKNKYNLVKNVVFLGDGPEKEKLIQFAIEQNVDEQCFFIGAHDDVQNYYSAAYLLIHSSIAFEGMPLVLVEAMHYSLPVISTDTMVGPREVLENGKSGLLCPVQDYFEMAEQMNALYNDSLLYKRLQEQGLIRKNDFSYERIGSRLNTIINNLK